MIVHSFRQRFSRSKTFLLNKISSHFISLMTKIFCFTKISQLPTFFQASKANQGVLNKDPTVWLHGARPANTWILPSFLENVPALSHIYLQKYIWKYMKIKITKLYMNGILRSNGKLLYCFVPGIVHLQLFQAEANCRCWLQHEDFTQSGKDKQRRFICSWA